MTFEIRPIDPSTMASAFDLATEVFVQGSTLHRALGIGLEDYRDYLREPFAAMIREGLSVAAMDPERGTLMGCLIAGDFFSEPDPPPSPASQFAPLQALTEALAQAYRQHRRFGSGEVLLVDMGAVTAAAAGRGVYQAMRKTVEDMARAKGFRWVVGELSNAATQHVVLNRLGHRAIVEQSFARFTTGKAHPFRSITEPPSIILAEGAL